MAERRITVDVALATTKALLQLTELEGGGLKFKWQDKTAQQLQSLFEDWSRRVDPTLPSMRDLLSIYNEQFPRLTGQTKQTFVNLFHTAPDPANPDQPGPLSEKAGAMKRLVEADSPDQIEVWLSFTGQLVATADYCLTKYSKLDEAVKTFKTCRAELRQLKEARVTAGLNLTPEEELKTKAKQLLRTKDSLRESIISCGEDKRKDYYKSEFGPVIGVPDKSVFDWEKIKTACHNQDYYGTLQEFNDDDVDLEEVEELKGLFDTIMIEIEALGAAGGRASSERKKSDFLFRQASRLLETFNQLDHRVTTLDLSDQDTTEISSDVWDEIKRKQVIEDITTMLADVRKLEMEGTTTPITEPQIETLKRVKLNFLTLNKSLERETRKQQKAEEIRKADEIRGLAQAKLPVLTARTAWLSWLSAYKDLAGNKDIGEERKKFLILQSLNKTDKEAMTNQSYQAIASYLRQKYHHPSLIIADMIGGCRALSQPTSEETMSQNILHVLNMFETCTQHQILDHFDSNFCEELLLKVFTKPELHEFLKERNKKRQEVRENLLASTLAGDMQQATIGGDPLMAADVAGGLKAEDVASSRTFMISYLKMKLDSLRVIAAQKELLYRQGGSGEKPAKTLQARKEPMKKVSTRSQGQAPAPLKMSTRKKPSQAKPAGAGSGPRSARPNDPVQCVLGCAPHASRKDIPTQSLFYCSKFLAASEDQRMEMLAKLKNACNICLGPKASHRSQSGACFLVYPCRYCGKAHNPLICREKTKEEKREIDNKSTQPMKKNEETTDGAVPLETVKKTVDNGTLVDSELTETALRYGHQLYGARGNAQAATAWTQLDDGRSLLTQFDNGSRPSLILAKTAKDLNLPVLRDEVMHLRTLSGTQRVNTKIYKLQLRDVNGNTRAVKVKSVEDLGGNNHFPRAVREEFANFWGLESSEIANPEGELQLILGQEMASLAPERVRDFVPPTNSPQTCLLRSVLVPELILYGTCGLDKEIMEETVKSAVDLEKFLQAESNVKIGNKCSECESTSCTRCKYETSQLSIVQQAELDEIEKSIEILDNPENGKKMFICQYVWEPGVDLYQKFHRKDSNYQQVKRSTIALRRRLEMMDKFDEFNELIQKELENGFLVQIDDNLDFFLSTLPDNYNRINLVFKASSTTTPIRVVNANNTKNRYGISINDAQVKGRTSINSTNRVLWHFQMNPVP